ncbi:enoyl-CoA hydratase-related protein [Sphingobium sp. Sx8-8]|uniref:enoyl-CoA hydratase/isomerase family protein n=1 Tax=Sphingobium sp. Sx8-8 TaxID=2933617 RepID=UPI001F58C9AE|nr:enoyl-CoA hydratase-related protein [Sphingobium sp. Sx8-8]
MTDILVSKSGGAAIVTLNRPEALNAMTIEMTARFNDAIRDAEQDPAVRAIVITGAGRAFCSGIDMAAVAEMSRTGNRRWEERGMTTDMPAQFANLLSVAKPVICAINGVAAGVGLVLALMSDIRIMDEGASMTTSFAKIGLISEHGTSWLLPRLVGTGKALDLLWTARKVGAAEAHAIGLADRLAPAGKAVEEALDFVAQLEASSPHSMARIKQMVYAHMDVDRGTAFRDADATVNACLSHPDVQEGLSAIREKRPAAFLPWPPPQEG